MTNPSHSMPRGLSRRSFLGLSAAAVSAAALSACGAGGTPPPPAGSATGGGGGGALTVLCEAGGKAELQPVADTFTKETGTQVTFVELPYDGLFNRLTSELASGNAVLRRGAMDAIWLPAFAGKLTPLDDLFTDAVQGRPVPGAGQRGAGRRASTSGCRCGPTPRSLLLPHRPVRGRQGEGGVPGQVRLRAGRADDLAAVHRRRAVLHPRHRSCTAPMSRARWRPSGWPTCCRPARRTCARPAGKVIIDNAAARGGADVLRRSATTSSRSHPRGGAGRLGGGAEPVQPGQDRDDAVLGARLPADPGRRCGSRQGRRRADDRRDGRGRRASPARGICRCLPGGDEAELAKKFIQFSYDHNDLCIDSALGLAARKSAFASSTKVRRATRRSAPAHRNPGRPGDQAAPGHREVAADRGHRAGPDHPGSR